MLLLKEPSGQLGKERGEGDRIDRGERRQGKETVYLTLSHARASRYWTKCRSISVLIFFTILSLYTTQLPVQNPLTGQQIQIHQFKYYKKPQEILLSNVHSFHK